MVKRGRPKKKPDYDKDEELNALVATAVELFAEPYDDRIERSANAPSIRDVARAMNTSTQSVRKLLITAGYFSTKLSRKVQAMHEIGCDVQQIVNQTGLKRASVHKLFCPVLFMGINITRIVREWQGNSLSIALACDTAIFTEIFIVSWFYFFEIHSKITKWCKLHIPLVGRIAAFLRKVLKEV